MNPAKRKLRINLAILRVLEQCDGYLLPEDAFFQQVGLEVKPTVLQSEFADCLKGLEEIHLVVGITDELGGPVKWKLTQLGKAKLSEM